MHNVLAMDIGGSRFRVALFDDAGRRLEVLEGETSRSGGRDWMLEQLRSRSRELLDRSDYPVKACGVSFGGPVDFRQQRVNSMHVPGWRGFRLGQWVEDNLSLKCLVDNDANAGALGEFRFGAGRGTESVLYLTISTGIGGGVVCGGKVHRGKDSMAGEVGHIPVSEVGALCSCGGRGCLETVCSGTAIGLRGRGLARRKPEVMQRTIELASGNPGQITAEAVFRAAGEGESGALLIVREAARALARARINITAFTAYGTGGESPIRLLVTSPARAKKVLRDLDMRVTEEDVLRLTLPDKPGTLAMVGERLAQAHINIDYSYETVAKGSKTADLVLAVSDLAGAAKALKGL